ncbi:flagellar motor protein MotB [Cystobacter fuscus]
MQRLHLEPSGLGSLVVGTGRTLAPGVVRVSLQGHYEHLPLNFLRTWDPGVNAIGLVENKFSGHVTAAVGVLPWLQLGAHLTYIIGQRGQRFMDLTPPRGGLDAPWLVVRAAPWRMSAGAPVNVAVELASALPVGRAELLGRDRYALAPRLQVGFVGEGFQVGGEVGALLRPRYDLSALTHREHDVMGSELRLGATVTSRGQNDTATRPEVSVLLNVPLQGGRTSAEVLIGVRKHLGPGVALYFLGGPGLGSAVDMPTLRLLAGAAFATGEAD